MRINKWSLDEKTLYDPGDVRYDTGDYDQSQIDAGSETGKWSLETDMAEGVGHWKIRVFGQVDWE